MEFLLVGVLVAVALIVLASAVQRWWTDRRPVLATSFEGLERTVEAVVELLGQIPEPVGRAHWTSPPRQPTVRENADRDEDATR